MRKSGKSRVSYNSKPTAYKTVPLFIPFPFSIALFLPLRCVSLFSISYLPAVFSCISTMAIPSSRLAKLAAHLNPFSTTANKTTAPPNIHQLSPTFFLERAAQIEPDAEAIYHITTNGKTLRRSYIEFADRTRGLAYFLKKHNFKRVGILAPNTPAFLESIFGIALSGAVNVSANYRLKEDDIAYIFDHAEADVIIVDQEFLPLLEAFRKTHPEVPFIIDVDTDATEGELTGPFDEAVLEGLKYDAELGGKGWSGLHGQCENENDMLALAYTSVSPTSQIEALCLLILTGNYCKT